MTSHLTADELAALQTSTLDRSTPFAIQGVSLGFFSVARHYGGATYNGASYTYFPESDELVRDDVARWVARRRKGGRPKRAKGTKAPGLFAEGAP